MGKKVHNTQTSNAKVRRELRREAVLLMLTRGYSQRAMVDELKKQGIKASITTISADLQTVAKRLQEQNNHTLDEYKQQKLAQLDEVLAVYADHWEYEETIGEGRKAKKIKKPNIPVLDKVTDVIALQCKIKGVYVEPDGSGVAASESRAAAMAAKIMKGMQAMNASTTGKSVDGSVDANT